MNLSSVKPIDPLIGVLRRVFSNNYTLHKSKKDLYISIVRSTAHLFGDHIKSKIYLI